MNPSETKPPNDESPHPPWSFPVEEWWRVLVRRRWAVMTCLVVAVAAAAAHSLLATPVYRARAVIQVKPQGKSVLTREDVTAVDSSYNVSYQDFYQTQPFILRSRKVVEMAVDRLDLPSRPEYANRPPRPIDRIASTVKSWVLGPPRPVEPRRRAVRFVSGKLSIEPVRYTQLIEITVVDRSPELARDIVNAVGEAYIQFDYSSWHDTTHLAREFLTKEVARVQAEIAALEQELHEYGRTKELVALGDEAGDISEQALGELNAAHVRALGRLAVAEANLAAVRHTPPESLPDVVSSPLIQGLKREYARLESEHALLAERFKPGWPALRETEEQLRMARERLEFETAAIAEQTEDAALSDYRRSKTEIEQLERQLGDQKAEVRRVRQAAIDYAGLRTAIETKRNVLHDLGQRQSTTESSIRLSDTDKQNIRFIDRADAALRHGPQLTYNLMLGLMLGLCGGVGLALLLEQLDNSVKNEAELKRVSGMPVLGHVPLFQPLRLVGEQPPSGVSTAVEPELASHADSRSGFAEAFKSLRTSLLLACPDQPPKLILVSSCEPADGKSTVSINLATVLAQLGRRVLLIDADLRRPRLHRPLGLSVDAGLSSLLSGNAPSQEVLQETEIPGVHAVACGPIPPNPTELVGTPLLVSFLHEMVQQAGFDHVILDTAPLTVFSDPINLATKVDATVLVVRAAKTSQHAVAHAITRLRAAKVNLVGTVLNALNERDQHYYYGNSYSWQGGRADGAARGRSLAATWRSRLRRRGGVG